MWINKKGNGSPTPNEPAEDPFEEDRLRMVREQIRNRGIDDERVLEAMREVPRHRFVVPVDRSAAYNDNPLPIGFGQTISQPYIVALMTECLCVTPDDRVLEIGTGSGYQSAILSKLAREVFSIELVEPLAEQAKRQLEELGCRNVRVRIGDGYDGWPEESPFDGIIVTAAPETIPEILIDQLAIGGRMVIPVGVHYQELILVRKDDDNAHSEKITDVRFVPLVRKKPE
jgi:protein-L-isoaspartate(D-aspartate) O-methyltransferase